MLRVLSSVGLTVGQFVHEIKYYLDNISDDINFLSKQLDEQTKELQRVLILDSNFAVFKTQQFPAPPHPAFPLHDDAGYALGRHTGNREPAHCRHR